MPRSTKAVACRMPQSEAAKSTCHPCLHSGEASYSKYLILWVWPLPLVPRGIGSFMPHSKTCSSEFTTLGDVLSLRVRYYVCLLELPPGEILQAGPARTFALEFHVACC